MKRSLASVCLIAVLAQGCTAAQDVPPPSTAKLEGSYWKLLALGDTNVASPAGARELHLQLQVQPDGARRVSGFSGCNRLMGGYTLDGERITFTQVASTMMACPTGMDLERDFHAMLSRVARWRMQGEQLEFLDAGGARIARFESR